MEANNSFFHYGYYVFLGLGDYHKPNILNKNWTARWRLKEWKIFLEHLAKLNVNTLMVFLNGHSLPYNSHLYTELVDRSHPNVKDEFFSEVLSCAKIYDIQIIIVLSTTGHTAKYLENNPTLSIKPGSNRADLEKLLLPFPDHIRKTKNLARSGIAQIGLGTLCHNNIKSQEYSINLIKECLTMYSQVDGVALHPPESIYPCFCEYCCNLFEKIYGKYLCDVNDEIAREFFLKSYLDFQKNSLENEIIKILPQTRIYTFTVPWLFENSFETIVNYISKDTTLIDWDYNLDIARINQLRKRLLRYQMHNHRIWFMPTAGFGFDKAQPIQNQINKVKMQIEIAVDSNISGIVYFAGPTWVKDLLPFP